MAQVIVILLLAVIGLFTMVVAFNEIEDAIAAHRRKQEAKRRQRVSWYNPTHCMPSRSELMHMHAIQQSWAERRAQVEVQAESRIDFEPRMIPQPQTVHDIQWVVKEPERIEVKQ